jgi:membrane-anchored protein YejM (alkaline phosphatase superfamily)
MCGTPLWGLAGAAASAYFAYLSYSHLITADYSWPHTWWTTLTYAVWVTVIGGLLTETPCRRERIFFGSMLIVFLLGLAFSAWSAAPEHAIRQLRIATTAIWALAALASLTTIFGSRDKADAVQRDSPEGAK